MNKVLFGIVLLFSKLPLWILYRFSDLFFVVNFLFIKYRKRVITRNLRNSFPDKSGKEIAKIRNRFYRNFFDYFVETLKAFTISLDGLKFRVQHINQDIFREIKDEGKDMILLSGHIFNWEWFPMLRPMIPQEHCYPVYKRLKSDFWDDKMRRLRGRFGNKVLERNEVLRAILRAKDLGNNTYMFVADQTPKAGDVHYGLHFLHQDTPVFLGYDRLSKKKDLAFVFCEMKKVKRGFYQVNYYRIYPDHEQFEPFEVVNKFYQLLEKTIHKHPDNWLWSHKRWKYKDALK